MAETARLDFDAGTEGNATITYCNAVPGSNPPVAGTPINVTGWTALLQFRTTPGSTTVLVELTDTLGITVGNTDGKFTIVLTPDQTRSLTPTCRFDLLATPPGLPPVRVVQGTAYTSPAVSRRS
jgi:hypothetical protein